MSPDATPRPRQPDPRTRDLVLDFADTHTLVADLTLPPGASMSVVSVLETSRELLRYSYYRYEFATVAVTHALVALEQVLAERLAADGPLQGLIDEAAATELLEPDLAAELTRGRKLRDRITRGALTSAGIMPLGALGLVRAVFVAASVLLRPPAAAAEVGGRGWSGCGRSIDVRRSPRGSAVWTSAAWS